MSYRKKNPTVHTKNIAKTCNSPVYSKSRRPHNGQGVAILTEEIATLQKSLTQVMKEVESLKIKHEEEAKSLRMAYNDTQRELEILRFEKEERIVNTNNGLDDYSNLILELIKLRTEVDRLSSVNDRAKRNDQIRDFENQIQAENYINLN